MIIIEPKTNESKTNEVQLNNRQKVTQFIQAQTRMCQYHSMVCEMEYRMLHVSTIDQSNLYMVASSVPEWLT